MIDRTVLMQGRKMERCGDTGFGAMGRASAIIQSFLTGHAFFLNAIFLLRRGKGRNRHCAEQQ
jgi:hypothetical protein